MNDDSISAAAALAVTTAKAAADLAQATASSAALVGNDISWIKTSVGEIKQTLKEMSGVFATKVEMVEISKIQEDHESRVRSLEQNMYKLIGIGSTAAAVIGVAGGWIANHLLK